MKIEEESKKDKRDRILAVSALILSIILFTVSLAKLLYKICN
jgi:hypothetical protein